MTLKIIVKTHIKEIKYVRLKLANGQTLIEGDPRNNNEIRYHIKNT